MSTCRCEIHKPKNNRVHQFVISKFPVRDKNTGRTSSICGIASCELDGLIWLTEDELHQYNKNKQRIFELYHTARSKVKVE